MTRLHFPPASRPFDIDERLVQGCLDPSHAPDRLFWRAVRGSLRALAPAERTGALACVTGHVAESVIEVVLADLGFYVLWHFEGPGRHGVDLLVFTPAAELVIAVEVKGTLRADHWPRLSRRELDQMSSGWIDKPDNPGMANWDLASGDVYGAVVLVNFAALAYRVAVTNDFSDLHPITDLAELEDLGWLKQ